MAVHCDWIGNVSNAPSGAPECFTGSEPMAAAATGAWRAATWALLGLLAAAPAQASDALRHVDRADFVAGDAAAPPPDTADWHPQPLPRRQVGPGWYRMQLSLAEPPAGAYAILLPRLRADATLFVNGVELASTAAGASLNLNIGPWLQIVPRSLMRAGDNTLHVRADTKAGASLMSDIEWGPATDVRAREASVRFWRATAPAMAVSMQAFFAFVTLLLWLRRPKESVYGHFGLAVLFFLPFACMSLMPSATPSWVAIAMGLCIYPFNPQMFVFALRYGGWRWHAGERALWLCAGVLMLAELGSLAAAGPLRHALDVFSSAASFMIDVPACIVLARVAWRRRSFEAVLVAVAATGALSWSAFTYYTQPFDALSWVPFGHVPLHLIVTWALVGRFARSLDESERLGAELADRIEAKRIELAANYRHLAELESRQAVLAERARLMSDIHDGIGGQLISTLSLVDSREASAAQVGAALRECLDDLRLVIDSMEPIDDGLLPVLGNLRYRLQPRLEAQGIELEWQVSDLPHLACLTPQNLLHVLRILQEALTNVLKHAGARRVRVRARSEGGRVAIELCDDGSGLGETEARRGRGLASMRRRAEALGADLVVTASAAGTQVRLVLPPG